MNRRQLAVHLHGGPLLPHSEGIWITMANDMCDSIMALGEAAIAAGDVIVNPHSSDDGELILFKICMNAS